jgi:hypothetical protein
VEKINMLKENIVTPKGTLVYPHLNRADQKFDKDGVWRASLRLVKKDAEPLMNQITKEIEDNAANETKKRNKTIKIANVPFSEDEDGNIVFNFKLKASGIRQNGEKWSQRPVLYDSKGNIFDPQNNIIWGGTEAKVAFQTIPYFVGAVGAGVSLRLKAVQIIELVTGTHNASSFGFKEEEGFEAEGKDEDVALEEAKTESSDF